MHTVCSTNTSASIHGQDISSFNFLQKLAPKALDYMLTEASVEQDKGALLTAMNAARQIGFKYKDLMKSRRDKVEGLQTIDPDAQNLKQITLDMIDGKT